MISVVTPTYNRREMLLDVIDSVKKQSYKDIELIIVDDCSTDGTLEMMQNYEDDPMIRYYRNEKNMGPGYNRNFGFCQVKGSYVVFMDDDDYYIDCDFLKKALEVLEQDSKLAFVSGNAYIENVKSKEKRLHNIGCNGRVDGIEFLTKIDQQYQKPMSTFTTVFRTEILRQAELETMKMVNDYAIYLRALLYGDVYILEDFVGVYREHGNNISTKIEKKFLIENLEERVWVKERLVEKTESDVVNEWWERQMKTLMVYYYYGTRPSIRDSFDILVWVNKNSKHTFTLYKTIIPLFVKSNIKNLLRK